MSYRVLAKARDVKAPVTVTTVESRNAALAAIDTIANLRKQDGLFVQRQGKRGKRLNMYQQDECGYLRSVGQVWVDRMDRPKVKNPKAYEAYRQLQNADGTPTSEPTVVRFFPNAHEAKRQLEYTIRKARSERGWTCIRVSPTEYVCRVPDLNGTYRVGYRRNANATQANVASEATVA